MTLDSETLQGWIARTVSAEIGCRPEQALAAMKLLAQGATVPFVARYRKEATGGLTDTQLRLLEERGRYLAELAERRETILASIREQGKLSAELQQKIEEAVTKQALEDLYLPYKPKRRTRAAKARECGLEPLADRLLADPGLDPRAEALAFVCPGYEDADQVLNGARDILAERFSMDAELLGRLREFLWRSAVLCSDVEEGKEAAAANYRDYFHYQEPLAKVPSHRALAVFRGRTEGLLTVRLTLSEEETRREHPCQEMIEEHFGITDQGRPADEWLKSVCRWTWRVKCMTVLETELFQQLKELAEAKAISVFGTNLKELLLAPPAGHFAVIGLDPGIRTGVKVAVISSTGAVLDTTVIYPHPPRNDREGAMRVLSELSRRHHATLVSIGNGTASRETVRLVRDLKARQPELNLTEVVVSEAGASVYSASEVAAKEFPDMDVSYRGAVSIARRLQDPLAELVKIDPKAIGVGQYQHDVNQMDLARKLNAVVEDCVNSVGVDANTASEKLLSWVAGMNSAVAQSFVRWREEHGPFRSRRQFLEVPYMGPRTYEQAAGFLRIPDAENPLDRSAVHPEAYGLADAIAKRSGISLPELIGNKDALKRLKPLDFVTEQFGLPTVKDIISELEKPGRDPRPGFATAHFAEGVEEIADVKPGMVLEGVVSNVTAFGAFVDIGVHQDGLVHISEIADSYVKNPADVLHVGQIVKVRVLDSDPQRKRISLSMRKQPGGRREAHDKTKAPATRQGGAMAEALMGAFRRR